MSYRIETDFLGSKEIPRDALYGIQSLRARENFPVIDSFKKEWYMAMGLVKQACYRAYAKFAAAVGSQFDGKEPPVQLIPPEIIEVLEKSAAEIAEGKAYDNFIVPATTGGAGTSINMNINEILANASLLKLNHKQGDYRYIDPVEMANVFQSTNDVVPTALKLALMKLLQHLEQQINSCRSVMEQLEKSSHHDLRIGYTQLQEAVPASFGKLFGSYNEALSRDWWRISKCFERIKLVNLGGGAIGTGMGIPRFYIMVVVQELQSLSGLPLARSENMPDITSNLDGFTEIHAVLKSHAVNLEKISNDLRLLGSDISGDHQVKLPPRQLGSTIMPGKVNPVIPEFVISVAHKVYSNDVLISALCGQGMLELNAYLPVIGDTLISSLQLLIAANSSLRDNLLTGLQWNKEIALERLYSSPALTTALNPYIGYHHAAAMAKMMKEEHVNVFECNRRMGVMSEEKLRDILQPDKLLKMGYTLSDIDNTDNKDFQS